jgi:hypothetical protein
MTLKNAVGSLSKNPRQVVKGTVLALVLLACDALSPPSDATAGTVVVDFEGLFGGQQTYVESGFRFSPSCHFDLVDSYDPFGTTPQGYNHTRYMGWDAPSGCPNPDFIGPPELLTLPLGAFVYVDYGGHPFSIESFFNVALGFDVLSSKGAHILSGDPQTMVNLSGPEWEGIKWVVFANDGFLCGLGAPSCSIDHITFRVPGVPEPTTLALLGIAFAGIGLATRRGLN